MGSTEGATIVVVGGGVTGLAAAWEIASSAAHVAVTVVEADTRLGGKVHAVDLDGAPVDVGPDAFVTRRREALDLCDELGLGGELVAPAERSASVFTRRRLRPMPAGLALGLPTRLGPLAGAGIMGPAGLAGCARDLAAPTNTVTSGEDAAVADIVAGRLGRQVLERLADPLVGGIHAGSTEGMSAAAVFPALLDADRAGGSLMRSLRARWPAPGPSAPPTGALGGAVFAAPSRGMVSLVDALAARCARRGVRVRTGCRVESLTRSGGGWRVGLTADGDIDADAVVVATPPAAAAALVAPAHDGLGTLLAGIDTAAVTLVTMAIPTPALRMRLVGSGFLSPAVYGRLLTACTYLCRKWPHLRRDGMVLLRASVGRAGDTRGSQLDDRTLVAGVLGELRDALGPFDDPVDTVVTRWADGFPQYRVGHLSRLARIDEARRGVPGLAIAGAAFNGVGVPACIGDGRRAGRAALAAIGTPSSANAPGGAG